MPGFWTTWGLDVTLGIEPPVWVPIRDNGDVVFGFSHVSTGCPGDPIAVVHAEGQAEVEKFIESHHEEIDAIFAAQDGAL